MRISFSCGTRQPVVPAFLVTCQVSTISSPECMCVQVQKHTGTCVHLTLLETSDCWVSSDLQLKTQDNIRPCISPLTPLRAAFILLYFPHNASCQLPASESLFWGLERIGMDSFFFKVLSAFWRWFSLKLQAKYIVSAWFLCSSVASCRQII